MQSGNREQKSGPGSPGPADENTKSLHIQVQRLFPHLHTSRSTQLLGPPRPGLARAKQTQTVIPSPPSPLPQFESMARGGGASPAPSRGQVYLPEWRRLYDRLLKMLREEHMLAEELSVQRAHLLAELEFQRIGRRESEEIFQARIQKVGGRAARVLSLWDGIGGKRPLFAASDAR